MTITGALPRARPEHLGIPSAAVLGFLEAVRQERQELHSLMILRHGRVAFEAAWHPHALGVPHMMRSVSKSFTSTAVGFAVQEGLLSIDDPLLAFFPAEAPARPSDRLRAVRVRHLLTMCFGYAVNSLGPEAQSRSDDWIATVLAAPMEHEPGSVFRYDNGASYLLSAIVQRRTGQRLVGYLGPRLFEPLGIRGATWRTCPRGIDMGSSGLSIAVEDLAKFGLFYLQRGSWNGRQLLSPAWTDAATARQVSTGDGETSDTAQGYGYQFWRCRHGAYRANGLLGQLCVVMPDQDAVVVTTAAADRAGAVLDAVWSRLLPAFAPGAITAPRADRRKLGTARRSCRIEVPRSADDPAGARRVDGRVFTMERNETGIETVALRLRRGRLVLDLGGPAPRSFRLGHGRWVAGTAALPEGGDPRPQPIAGTFWWIRPGELVATVRWIGAPIVVRFRLRFEGDDLLMSTYSTLPRETLEQASLHGRCTNSLT